MKLNCVRLLVGDFDESFRFYTEKLGLNVVWGKPGGDYANFDIGIPGGLSIYKTDLMAKAIGNTEKSLPIDKREKIAIILNVPDVDKTYRELAEKGVPFINEPKDMTGWGMRAAHFRDPEGNLLEIWSELPREKWDQDLLDDAKEFEQ